jgi:micrococcal nuclease
MKNILIVLCLLVSIVCKGQFTVVKVYDGDSFRCYEETSEQFIEVRIAFVDAPEQGMKGYEQSKEYLERLILNKKILVDIQSFDIYRRMVCIVKVGNLNVNQELIKSGNAFVYDKYCKDSTYYTLQSQAKLNTLGIWRYNQVRPEIWRKNKKYHKS